MSRDLVLGFCAHYSFDKVEPFIASFLHHRAGTELCLIATNMDERFHAVAGAHGIRVLDATRWADLPYHMQNGRFFMYRDFLAEHGHRYDRVMVSDIRDAFFQGDPFNTWFPHDICFALEDTRLSAEPLNQQWLRDIYHSEGLVRAIAHNPVCCSGTTLGTTPAMIRYIDDMCREIGGRNYDRSRANDQGMHNYIVWHERRGEGADWDDRVVQTVGCTPDSKVRVERGLVLIGELYAPVIHQWDRKPAIRDLVATSPVFRIPA